MNLSWNAGLISHLLTLVVFAFVGFKISNRFPLPKNFFWWTLLVVATIFAVYIGPDIELIGVDFFGIYLNTLLMGLGIGLIIGFLSRKQKHPVNTMGAAVQ
jgi:hypothetical protein